MAKTPGINRLKSERPRSPRDYYRTPRGLVVAALEYLIHSENYWSNFNIMSGANHVQVLDPGCGDAVWSQSAYYHFTSPSPYFRRPYIHAVDLEPQAESTDEFTIYRHNFLDWEFAGKQYNVVIGNPPYSLAEEFIRKSLSLVEDRGYVYFLLQLNFLGSQRRQAGLFSEHPLKELVVLGRRPSFFSVDNKTNSTDTLNYAMFLWQKGYRGKPVLSWLDWNYLEA